ncbi:hypothetical protein XENTR_v10020776 [Xenopus tropicalis]|nr:hypothetical protein XENTR_v10020776 [Xenopus tropicalis]
MDSGLRNLQLFIAFLWDSLGPLNCSVPSAVSIKFFAMSLPRTTPGPIIPSNTPLRIVISKCQSPTTVPDARLHGWMDCSITGLSKPAAFYFSRGLTVCKKEMEQQKRG